MLSIITFIRVGRPSSRAGFVVLSGPTLLSVFQRRLHGEEKDEYAETECGLHAAGDPQLLAGRGRWREADAADRGYQETVGLHQEEWSAGQEEQTDDQRRRQLEGRVRRQ